MRDFFSIFFFFFLILGAKADSRYKRTGIVMRKVLMGLTCTSLIQEDALWKNSFYQVCELLINTEAIVL